MAANPPTNNSPQADLRTFLSIVKRVTRSFRSQSIQAQEQKQTQNFAQRFIPANEQQIKRIASQLLRNYGNKSLIYLTKVHPGYRGLNNPQQVLDKLLSTYIRPDYKSVDRYIAAIEAGYESPQALALEEEQKVKSQELEQKPLEKKDEGKKQEEKRRIGGGTPKRPTVEEKTQEEQAKAETPVEQKPQEAKISPRWDNPALAQIQEKKERLIRAENKRIEDFWKRQEEKNDALFAKNRQKIEEAFKSSREKQERLFEKPRQIESKFYSFGGGPQIPSQGLPASGSYFPQQPAQGLPPRFPFSRPLDSRIPKSLAGNIAKTTAKRYFLLPLIIAILIIGFFTILYPIFDNLLKSTALLPTDENQGAFCALNINACTFYRANVGAQFGNPAMANIVTDVSSKVGVPPSLVAAVMRVECGDCMSSQDPSYVSNDYDAHTSSAGAVGIMQFIPSTFTGIFNLYKSEMALYFGKTAVTTQIPSSPPPPNSQPEVLKIYSIRDSIIATAFKIKADNPNANGVWDEFAVRTIASIYFSGKPLDLGGSTKYPDPVTGPNDYGTDLWASYSSCKIRGQGAGSGPLGLTLTCPLDPIDNSNFAISCGTAENPVNGCGHGHRELYRACSSPPYATCPFSDQLKAAIDVIPQTGAAAGVPVYLPFINGNQSVEWNLIQGPTAIAGGSWGYKMVYEGSYNGKKLTLDLTHLSSNVNNSKTLNSGDKVGVVSSQVPHLHTAVAVDGVWVEAAKEAFMCFKE